MSSTAAVVSKKLGQAFAVWVLAASLVVIGAMGFVLGGLPGKLVHSVGLALVGAGAGSFAAVLAGAAIWKAWLGVGARSSDRARIARAEETRAASGVVEGSESANLAVALFASVDGVAGLLVACVELWDWLRVRRSRRRVALGARVVVDRDEERALAELDTELDSDAISARSRREST